MFICLWSACMNSSCFFSETNIWSDSLLVGKKCKKQVGQKRGRVKTFEYCEFILPLLLWWGKHFQSPPLPKRNNPTRENIWGPTSFNTNIFLIFLSYTNGFTVKLFCIWLQHRHGSAAVLEKCFLRCLLFHFFFSSVMAKKEWSHFIPIQSGAREKWFGLNRTTVLLLFCPARRLYRAQRCWIQSYSCGSWFRSKFSVKRYFPFFPFTVWSVLQTCARSLHTGGFHT